jgi:hypothetical protein
MVLILPLWEHRPKSGTSTIALFGFQYRQRHDSIKPNTALFEQLLLDQQVHVETHFEQGRSCHTLIFTIYWFESASYQAWWTSSSVQGFWTSRVLANGEAGIWREALTISPNRFMHTTGGPSRPGFASIPDLSDVAYEQTDAEVERKQYWGIYRRRVPDWQEDSFESPFAPLTRMEEGKPPINIIDPSPQPAKVRPGRVFFPHGIDNLLWVHEYQDYSHAEAFEKSVWQEKIAAHAESWITHLETKRDENGVLSFRRTTSGQVAEGQASKDKFSQFMYFLDIAQFENAGKSYRDHRLARSAMERLYRAHGQMEDGKIQLMVELAVLKAEDLEAEYVGCTEDTGLMSYEQYML